MYEYALSKPLNNGGAPSGYVSHRRAKNPLSWKYRHGVVRYDRPVSRDDLIDYNMLALTVDDPRFMEEVYKLVKDDIVTQMVDTDRYVTVLDGGKMALIEHDYDNRPLKYVIRVLDRSGDQIKIAARDKDLEKIVRALWNLFSPKRQKTYIDIISRWV